MACGLFASECECLGIRMCCVRICLPPSRGHEAWIALRERLLGRFLVLGCMGRVAMLLGLRGLLLLAGRLLKLLLRVRGTVCNVVFVSLMACCANASACCASCFACSAKPRCSCAACSCGSACSRAWATAGRCSSAACASASCSAASCFACAAASCAAYFAALGLPPGWIWRCLPQREQAPLPRDVAPVLPASAPCWPRAIGSVCRGLRVLRSLLCVVVRGLGFFLRMRFAGMQRISLLLDRFRGRGHVLLGGIVRIGRLLLMRFLRQFV